MWQDAEGSPWDVLKAMESYNTIVGAVLAVVHPRLYAVQMDVMVRLSEYCVEFKTDPALLRLLEMWPSPFNTVTMTTNRETPLHRHTTGGVLMPEIFGTFGGHPHCRLEVPLLSGRFEYSTGTCFIMPPMLLEHGISRTSRAERISLVSGFRPRLGRATLGHAYEEVDLPMLEDLEALQNAEEQEGTGK